MPLPITPNRDSTVASVASPVRDVARCPHCGTPVEGSDDEYCCGGCRLAATIIRDAGLDRYYREREEFAPRPQPLPGGWDTIPVTIHPDGTAEARLMVDGFRCASCVWLTENLLQRAPGVAEASVSYATGRATLRWYPEKTDLGSLAGRIAALGYHPRLLGEESAPDRGLVLRLGVATFAALNIMLMSVAVYAGWITPMAPRFLALFQWASLVLATPVVLWCAEPFYRGAIQGLRHGALHMDLPIAMAVVVLYVHGLVATLGTGEPYFDSLTMLVALLLAGRMLESRGRRRAAEAATSLAATMPATARRATGDRVETVPADQLEPGDIIEIGAGEQVPADGVVVAGEGLVAMALVTGEADPIPLSVGRQVVGGTFLESGAITVRVEAVGAETVVSGMAEELRTAAERPVRPSSGDRIAPWFTAATITVATATFMGWWWVADVNQALTTAVAVLVVACPCALALSRPLASAAGLGAAARRGLLLRSADALLELNAVDTVAFDKTGTVTHGAFEVIEAKAEVLRIAAGLERFSHHPIARAIIAETIARGIPLPRGEEVAETSGVGITGLVDGRRWWLRAGESGEVLLCGDDGPVGSIRLGDIVREDSLDAVRGLERLGKSVTLLSGDHRRVGQRIGVEAGIDDVVAPLGPAGKADWIASQQAAGHHVLFGGDGLNDGPALARADVGVAMGTGAASSVLVADGVISVASIGPVVAGFHAALAARRAIRVNVIRSILYNISAVAAAAVGLINPLVAAVLMPLSSGMVIWESARVERRVVRALR